MSGILGPKLPILLGEIKAFQPRTYIEIGCYQCTTMAAVQRLGVLRVIGFDLFDDAEKYYKKIKNEGAGDECLPLEGPPMKYTEAKRRGFEVYMGDTKETLLALPSLEIEEPVFVFLDGGHSYETVKSDWTLIQEAFPKATVVIDDVSYPGVAKLIREIEGSRKLWLGHYLIKVMPEN